MNKGLNQIVIGLLVLSMAFCDFAHAADSSTLAPKLSISGVNIKEALVLEKDKLSAGFRRTIDQNREFKTKDAVKLLLSWGEHMDNSYNGLGAYIVLYLQELRKNLRDAQLRLSKAENNLNTYWRLEELEEKVSQAGKKLSIAGKRIELLNELIENQSVPQALKMIENGAKIKKTPTQRFVLDVLEKETASYPDIDFNPQEVLFIPENSWLNDLFNFDVNGRLIHLSDDNSDCLMLIKSSINNEAELLSIMLREIAYKRFIYVEHKIKNEIPELLEFYHTLEEIKVDELGLKILKKICQRNEKAKSAIVSYVKEKEELIRDVFELKNKAVLPYEEIVYRLVSGYVTEKDFQNALVNVFGSDVETELDRFLYEGEFAGLKGVLGDEVFEALVYLPAEVFYSEDYSLKETLFYLFTETLNKSKTSEIAKRLKQLNAFLEDISDISYAQFYSWLRRFLLDNEFIAEFEQIKDIAVDELFEKWINDRTGERKLNLESLYRQIGLEMTEMFEPPEVTEKNSLEAFNSEAVLEQSI